MLSWVAAPEWTQHEPTSPRSARAPALLKFIAVVATSYVANLCVVLVAIEAGVDSYVAQALGVPIYAALAYLGLRHVAFAQRAQG